MSEHRLQDTIALLARTPAALDALLHDLPEVWTETNEGEDTYSPKIVVAHLIQAERTNWIPRVKTLLEFGESRVFERFDRDEDERERLARPLPQLLDEFAVVRRESLDALRVLNLRDSDLAKRGRHPSFGPVTLSQLLATWAAHDLTHLHQISRVMAHQYREAVGPWIKYLGVLHCNGHSSSD
ncbi:MAG TPA: DinB family protein [Terriglobales bacterium]|nr:DinB family protein [Terriglobales bacterium]